MLGAGRLDAPLNFQTVASSNLTLSWLNMRPTLKVRRNASRVPPPTLIIVLKSFCKGPSTSLELIPTQHIFKSSSPYTSKWFRFLAWSKAYLVVCIMASTSRIKPSKQSLSGVLLHHPCWAWAVILCTTWKHIHVYIPNLQIETRRHVFLGGSFGYLKVTCD